MISSLKKLERILGYPRHSITRLQERCAFLHGKWWNWGYEMEITHENIFVSSVKGETWQGRASYGMVPGCWRSWSKNPRYWLLRDSKRTLVTKNPQSAQYQDRLIKKQATWLVEFQPYRVERSRSMASVWKLGNIHKRVLSHFSLVSNSFRPYGL